MSLETEQQDVDFINQLPFDEILNTQTVDDEQQDVDFINQLPFEEEESAMDLIEEPLADEQEEEDLRFIAQLPFDAMRVAEEREGEEELDIEPPAPLSRASRDLPPQAIAPKARPLISDSGLKEDLTKISVQEWSADESRMKLLREFFEARFGDRYKQKEDQTNEEYFEQFLTYKRALESNFINLGQEIDWIRTADVKDRDKLVQLYMDVDKNVPGFATKGGGDVKSALLDYFFFSVSDPMVLLTGLVGRFFTKGGIEAIKEVLKNEGRKEALKKAKQLGAKRGLIIGSSVDGSAGVARSVGLQRVEQANVAQSDVDIDLVRAGVSGLIEGTFGAVATREFEAGRQASIIEQTDKLLQKRKEDVAKYKTTKEDAEEADKIVENINRKKQNEAGDDLEIETEILAPIDGKQLLDELGNASNIDMVDVKVKNDLLRRQTKIAETIFKQHEESGTVKELANALGMSLENFTSLKIGEMVNVLTRTDAARMIDPDLYDRALAKAGLTSEQFTAIAAVSRSEAGAAIGMLGPLGVRVNKFLKDPANKEFAEAMDLLSTSKRSKHDNFFYKFFILGGRRLDRENRALSVIQLGTLVGNIASLFGTQTMQVFANAIESGIYHTGRSLSRLATGKASFGATAKGAENFVKDTLSPLLYLRDPVLAQEMTEYLTKYNPNIARTIDRSVSGFDENTGLSKFTMFANHLNMVLDIYGRRALFAADIDKKLRRVGENYDKLVARGGELNTEVLRDSARQAVMGTFAAMPRKFSTKGEGDVIGRGLEHVGHGFVRLVEMFPFLPGIGTGEFPFARFMVNALGHQLTYSPAGLAKEIAVSTKSTARAGYIGIQKMFLKHGKELDEASNPVEVMRARDRLAKGIIGSALLYAGFKYREENQDLPATVIRTDDGDLYNVARYWPFGAHLALADLLVKINRYRKGETKVDTIDIRKFINDYTGVRYRRGDYAGVAEDMVQFLIQSVRGDVDIDISIERFADRAGDYFGEVTGRAITGLGFVSDIISYFDENEAVARDPSQVEGSGFSERFYDAATKRWMYRVPILKQNLPIREFPTREDDKYRMDPLLRAFFGTTTYSEYNTVEKELRKHNIKDFTITMNTGDKKAAAHVNKYLGPLIEYEMVRLVKSETYKKLSIPRQANEITQAINKYNEYARQLATTATRNVQPEGPTSFDRGAWLNLGKTGRVLADDMYMDTYNKTVEQMQKLEPNVNHLGHGVNLGRIMRAR